MTPPTDEAPAGSVLDAPHIAEPISAHDEHGANVPAAVNALVADATGVTSHESWQNLHGIEVEGEEEQEHISVGACLEAWWTALTHTIG